MGIKYNPFSGSLELTEGTPVYISAGIPPGDKAALWVDSSDSFSRVSPYILQTGSVISFDRPIIFNTPTAPATSLEITHDLAGAQLGLVQKIYHQSATAPVFPQEWVLMRDVAYLENTLNVIYAEWVDNTRIEYWILHEY